TRKNIPRAMLPVDARSLYRGVRADEELRENALSFEGKVDFTPEESGYGGSLIVDAEAGIEILPEGGLPDSDFAGVSLVADDLNARCPTSNTASKETSSSSAGATGSFPLCCERARTFPHRR
ncbi:hypothetical protein, partial [Salmonella sp. M265]|uniref:hypothetical protein n=1 Tax=Salmonella sp. M265 TaxID=3240301 RepID=UPI00352B4505